jgi:hypothetical protein
MPLALFESLAIKNRDLASAVADQPGLLQLNFASSFAVENDCDRSVPADNHAHGMVACDFFVSVTACFRILSIFVALEIGSRRLVHFNVTEHSYR